MGEKYEKVRKPVDDSPLDSSGGLGRPTTSWPAPSRIDIIGQNGNEGQHYDNCCPRHSEEEDDD